MIEAKSDCLINDDTLLSYRKSGKEILLPPANAGLPPIHRIGAGAMMNDYTVKSIHVQEGITDIGANAFAGCTDLKYMNLPPSVKRVAPTAFERTNSLVYISFYSSLSEEKYQEITENSIQISDGEYLLDPMILEQGLREQIYSFMPSARWKVFPIDASMDYFYSQNRIFAFRSYVDKRKIMGKYDPIGEEEAICHMISDEKEGFLLNEKDDNAQYTGAYNLHPIEDMPSTALVFLAKLHQENDGERIVRIVIRREKFFHHKAYKVIIDGRVFYVCFRYYFNNDRPVYIRNDKSIEIYTKNQRLLHGSPYRDEVMKKYTFAVNYL